MNSTGKTTTFGPRDIYRLINMLANQTEDIMMNKNILDLMHTGRKYDLIVIGWFFNDYYLGLAGHFKCPSVLLSTVPGMKTLLDLTGNPTEISHVPFTGEFDTSIEFFARLKRFMFYAAENIGMYIVDRFIYENVYNKYFPVNKHYPSFAEVKKNVSLILTNHHFSQGAVRAYVPNMIEIGGIQIKENSIPLPKVRFDRYSYGSVLLM